MLASAAPAASADVTGDATDEGAGALHAVADDAQRRVVRALVATQALGGVGVTTGIAVSSLLAAEIVDSDTLSGLPQTAQVVGAALMAFVLARVMDARGRRPGLVLGYVVGLTGGAFCVMSAVAESFPLLLLGTLMLGSATAVNSLSRYAATDLAQPSRRARALSVVVGNHVGCSTRPEPGWPGRRSGARSRHAGARGAVRRWPRRVGRRRLRDGRAAATRPAAGA